MRADVQNSVDAIEKSLALLAQRLGYDTAPYRLEEFNARVEDPTLWDDPDAAQKLMRDRQNLVDAIGAMKVYVKSSGMVLNSSNWVRWKTTRKLSPRPKLR